MTATLLLRGRILACHACRLATLREGIAVPGEGAHGGLGFIAEAPGYYEAQQGRPLVGPAGGVFDRVLAAAGVHRAQVYVGNRVRCKPPANRLADYPDAVYACNTHTQSELDLYAPRVVVLLGRTAYAPVFGDNAVWKVRGTWRATSATHEWRARTWTCTYHPAAALPRRKPELFDVMVEDVVRAKEMCDA